MMNIVAKHKIGDMVIHKVSKKEHLVIGYSYVESRGLSYIIIGDDQIEFTTDGVAILTREEDLPF